MKKNLFKVVALLILSTMIFGMVACSSAPEKQADKTDVADTAKTADSSGQKSGSVPEISFMNYWAEEVVIIPLETTLIAKKWQEDVGFKFKLINTPIDTYDTKVSVVLSSNDIPDIMVIRTSKGSDIMNEYGPKGLFLSISDNLDKLPNVKKMMSQFPDWSKIMQAEDGKTYGLPGSVTTYNDIYRTTSIIRNDLLKKGNVDISKIETLEDLTNALRVLKIQLGGKAPWIQRNGYAQFMTRAGYLFGTNYREYWDEETNKMVHPAKTENFKKLVTWLAQLYKEGLIHPDWTTMSDETWEQLLGSNQGAFLIDRFSIVEDPNFDKSFDFQPIVYPKIDGKRYKQPKQAALSATEPYVINPKSKNLDVTLKAIDYMFDEKNIFMFIHGIEGKTYVKDNGPDATMSGIKWMVQIYGLNANDDSYDSYQKHGVQMFGIVRTADMIKSNVPRAFTEGFFKFSDQIEKGDGFAGDAPILKFTQDEMQVKKAVETQIDTFFDENIVKFISNQSPMSGWDKFVKDIEGMGLDKVQKVYDDALIRWNNLK